MAAAGAGLGAVAGVGAGLNDEVADEEAEEEPPPNVLCVVVGDSAGHLHVLQIDGRFGTSTDTGDVQPTKQTNKQTYIHTKILNLRRLTHPLDLS